MSEKTIKPPKPGSDEARKLGCKCPDSRNGQGMAYPNGPAFWIAEKCPLHGNRRAVHDAGVSEGQR